ncbi:MAG: hypothetical protein HC895_25935 [Leptolyngbyaceae cyanobacterium SM1_3_5]|nr:hypothetical protein [Leptolyngbyaceae cyanobacterium SM1_3_5]
MTPLRHLVPVPPALPTDYRAQSVDTSVEADWVLFEQLRQMPVHQRHQRFRSFNHAWRSRLWWLSCQRQNAAQTYLQRRYGAAWLAQQDVVAITQIPPTMILDPITYTLKIAAILDSLNLAYYVGGSVASSLHGESRSTRDVDLAVMISPEAIDSLIQAFAQANFYISESSVYEAVESIDPARSFNVIDITSSEKADIFPLKRNQFAQSQMSRRQVVEFPEGQIYVCTPEDIILQKLRWRRMSHSTEQWNDILGVMKLQQMNLDRDYLWTWAPQLGVEVELAQALQQAGL